MEVIMVALRLAVAAAIPLLGSAASSLASPPVSSAPVQMIFLQSYFYAPAPIYLTAGKAVTLNFVNRAGKGHDFTAQRFFATSRILSGRVPDGEVELSAGQSAGVTLIPAAGTYTAHCSHPFHKLMGMHTTIIVR
jgi:plastocyanin